MNQDQTPPEGVKIEGEKTNMEYHSSLYSNGTYEKKPNIAAYQSPHPYPNTSPTAAYDPSMVLSRLMVDNPPSMDFKPEWMLGHPSYAPPFVPFKKPFPVSDHYTTGSSHNHSKNTSNQESQLHLPTNMMSSAFSPAFGTNPEAALNMYNYPFYPTMDPQRTAASQMLIKNEAKNYSSAINNPTFNTDYVPPTNLTTQVNGTVNNLSNNNNTSPNHTNSTTTTTISNTIPCDICGHAFRDASSLRRHTRTKHASKFQQMEDTKNDRKKYKCTICHMSLSCSGSIHRHM